MHERVMELLRKLKFFCNCNGNLQALKDGIEQEGEGLWRRWKAPLFNSIDLPPFLRSINRL